MPAASTTKPTVARRTAFNVAPLALLEPLSRRFILPIVVDTPPSRDDVLGIISLKDLLKFFSLKMELEEAA